MGLFVCPKPIFTQDTKLGYSRYMSSSPARQVRQFPKPKIISLLLIIFMLVVGVLIFGGLKASQLFRQQFASRQAQQMKAPTVPTKREVKRLLLKKTLEDGSINYYEILSNGVINIFDENMNLIKTDFSSYYRVKALFDKINANLDGIASDSQGKTILTIYTNMGEVTIIIDDDLHDELDDIIDDILDDIDDVIDDAFAPTPTLQPTSTPAPGQPTSTPAPTPTSHPIGGPSATPAPNATPTPLPDYMTAPPFKCSDYENLGRPINISNVICGAD